MSFNGIIFIPGFVKIDEVVQTLKQRHDNTHIHIRHGNFTRQILPFLERTKAKQKEICPRQVTCYLYS